MITETNPNLVPSLRVAIPSPQVKRRGGGYGYTLATWFLSFFRASRRLPVLTLSCHWPT